MSDASKPAFLITIDTEGDDLWSVPERVTTLNARCLPRFQALCERYALAPTWLTNYEMAECPEFVELGRDVIARGVGEVGMHLHAWDSPPVTGPKATAQAYLIEYPDDVMRAKVTFMTDLLAERFGQLPVSHRAGRWALDGRYARCLVEHGYTVDCSVTPHVSWSTVLGDPDGAGGADYTDYPCRPYFVDLDRIDREGASPLLEVPMSIVTAADRPRRGGRDAPSLAFPREPGAPPTETWWLRPNGRNLDAMLAILDFAHDEDWPCVEFMLHSSELMPGGSPTFRTEEAIETLYDDLDALFGAAAHRFRGETLREFRDAWGATR